MPCATHRGFKHSQHKHPMLHRCFSHPTSRRHGSYPEMCMNSCTVCSSCAQALTRTLLFTHSLHAEKYSEKLRSAYDEIRSGGRQEEGSEEAKKAQKEQREKTFWEKNWMFVLAGAMLLFNVVATKPPPSGGAAPQGRPAR